MNALATAVALLLIAAEPRTPVVYVLDESPVARVLSWEHTTDQLSNLSAEVDGQATVQLVDVYDAPHAASKAPCVRVDRADWKWHRLPRDKPSDTYEMGDFLRFTLWISESDQLGRLQYEWRDEIARRWLAWEAIVEDEASRCGTGGYWTPDRDVGFATDDFAWPPGGWPRTLQMYGKGSESMPVVAPPVLPEYPRLSVCPIRFSLSDAQP